MYKPDFVYAVHIATTPEKLWEALTQPAFIRRYFFDRRVETDWKPGSKITFYKPDGSPDILGEVTRFEPPKVLAYTFYCPAHQSKRKVETLVTCQLIPSLGGVKLLLTHENLLAEDYVEKTDGLEGINNGWPAILSNLKSLLETGKPCLDLSKAGPGA